MILTQRLIEASEQRQEAVRADRLAQGAAHRQRSRERNVTTPSRPQERAPTPERLHLTLFVSGASPTSARAEHRLRDMCDRHWPSGYDLNIVDIYQEPAEVVARGVLAVPTLIKELPPPVQVLIDDFANKARVLAALACLPRHRTKP